jgi:hypothetical protein
MPDRWGASLEGKGFLTVVNQSEWPTPFVTVIGQWICTEVGIDWPYELRMYDYHPGAYRGRGNKWWQKSKLNRRHGVRDVSDQRYKNVRKYEVYSDIEAFIFLVAHEACHANSGHPGHWRAPGRKTLDRKGMERHCDEIAMLLVAKFRQIQSTLLRRVKEQWRESGWKRPKPPFSQRNRRLARLRMGQIIVEEGLTIREAMFRFDKSHMVIGRAKKEYLATQQKS